MSANSWRLF
jgi:glycine hydroxymethyltransferase